MAVAPRILAQGSEAPARKLEGRARLGRRTKLLIGRLSRGDIAVIDHLDLDRVSAEDLINAGDNVAFDMSDQAPAAFGGTAGSGEWADLQAWVRNTSDTGGTLAKLEADAKAAYGH